MEILQVAVILAHESTANVYHWALQGTTGNPHASSEISCQLPGKDMFALYDLNIYIMHLLCNIILHILYLANKQAHI